MTELICTEPGIGIERGSTFQVLSENGSEWEILLGNEYWLITSCRSANNIMPITIFLPAGTASFFYSA